MRKILVSIFDGVSNGGALREISDLAGRLLPGKIYGRTGRRKAAKRPHYGQSLYKSGSRGNEKKLSTVQLKHR
ncbi:hypothetical protein GQG94_004607 [Salmonella enterica]|nr:hypothetical protein [Salmonella enterica subsp. enterica serovar Mbandaka]EEJ1220310.1 hypothetical protein [Salmonella enterica]